MYYVSVDGNIVSENVCTVLNKIIIYWQIVCLSNTAHYTDIKLTITFIIWTLTCRVNIINFKLKLQSFCTDP